MKLAAIVVALVAAVGAVHADDSTLGHPLQFYREGSFGEETAGSLRRYSGSTEDTVVIPTPQPTTLPTPAPTESGSGPTPAPTSTSDDLPTPAPTTTGEGLSSSIYGELGVAYSVTREEVDSASSGSSYTVPIAVAGCVAAVAAVAGVAVVMRKRKLAAQADGETTEYSDNISTPVVKIEYNDDIATPVA